LRDLLVFAVVMLMLPGSFRKPFLGLLLFSWLAYMRPQDLCWGFARTMRLSFFVGLAMVLGWWANEGGRRRFTYWDVRTKAMVVLAMFITVSYAFAEIHDEYTNKYFAEYLKIILVALFTAGQVDSPARFRVMLWTIALCLGFFGIKGGVFGVLGGGRQILRGPGGMLEDNNDFALALVMNVPLLWYMGVSERAMPLIRRGTQIAVFLTVITVVLTHSRGAFLALTATSLWMAWRSGQLFKAFGFLAVLALLFPLVAPQDVLERLSTIGNTQESSTNSRLVAWGIAFRMIEAHPVLGVGMRNFKPRYFEFSGETPGPDSIAHVAHNSYLQIWAESGTPAFLVYMLLLVSVFFACRKVFAIGRARPDLRWAMDYARMMEATTVAFLVGAFFLNRGHFDLIYHWVALVTSLLAVAVVAYRRAPTANATGGAGDAVVAVPAAAATPGGRRITVRWRDRFGGPAGTEVVTEGAPPRPTWERHR